MAKGCTKILNSNMSLYLYGSLCHQPCFALLHKVNEHAWNTFLCSRHPRAAVSVTGGTRCSLPPAVSVPDSEQHSMTRSRCLLPPAVSVPDGSKQRVANAVCSKRCLLPSAYEAHTLKTSPVAAALCPLFRFNIINISALSRRSEATRSDPALPWQSRPAEFWLRAAASRCGPAAGVERRRRKRAT